MSLSVKMSGENVADLSVATGKNDTEVGSHGCTVGENVYSNHGCGSTLNSCIQWKPLETSTNLFRSVN